MQVATAFDKALPAPADADAFGAVGHRRTDDRADRRVHAGSVSTARQNTDTFRFSFAFHMYTSGGLSVVFVLISFLCRYAKSSCASNVLQIVW